MSKGSHSSAVGALDAFFAVVREKASEDQDFAAALVKALSVPIEFQLGETVAANDAIVFIDPVELAGRGLDAFRSTVKPFKDAEIKKIIKAHNLATADHIRAMKGDVLKDFLWEAASQKRDRLLGKKKVA